MAQSMGARLLSELWKESSPGTEALRALASRMDDDICALKDYHDILVIIGVDPELDEPVSRAVGRVAIAMNGHIAQIEEHCKMLLDAVRQCPQAMTRASEAKKDQSETPPVDVAT